MASQAICSADGCDNVATLKRLCLCDKHYRRILHPPKTGYEFPCEGCRRTIVKRRGDHRFCEGCARRRKLEYARAYSSTKSVSPGLYEGKRRSIADLPRVKVACAECGELAVKTGWTQKYCPECARIRERDQDRKRAREKRAKLPPRVRTVAPKKRRIKTEAHRSYMRSYEKNRRERDPQFAVNARMKAMVANVLRGEKNGRSWKDLVGYSAEDLVRHLERQFLPRMSWANRRDWDIDHIRPVASFQFDSAESEAFRECWALTNLRPLWRADNRRKSDNRTFLL